MAHDYAKKSRTTTKKAPAKRSPRKKPAPASPGVPGWVWLFVGTAMGAFVMFLIRLADIDPNAIESKPQMAERYAPAKPEASKPEASRPSTSNKPVAASKPKPTEPSEQQKPRFDFYKMLKENEVPVAEPTQEQAAQKTQKPRTFILQVASFKQPADAEELKVELILLGLEARSETVTVRNGEVWHRVLAGPFDNRSKLSKARNRLISNGHQALVLEYKGDKEG